MGLEANSLEQRVTVFAGSGEQKSSAFISTLGKNKAESSDESLKSHRLTMNLSNHRLLT